MKELVSLPASIREQFDNLPTIVTQKLEEAKVLADQGKPKESDDALRVAATELARSRPEICALLIAASLGFKEISTSEHHNWTTYQVLNRYFLGMKVGETVVPLRHEHRIEKRWNLS